MNQAGGPGGAARRGGDRAGGQGDGRPGFSQRRPDRPFIPFVAFEDVVAKCGHTEKFGLLPDGKDRFRADRRKKVTGRDCTACRQARALKEQQELEVRRAERESRRAAEAARPQATKVPGPKGGRLPDGSRYEIAFDAAAQRWSGTLTVPKPGGEPLTFTGSGSGLFPLLTALDGQYRAATG